MTALRMLEVFTLSTKKKGRIDESNGRVTRRIQKLQPRGPAMATSAKGTSINYFIAKTSGLEKLLSLPTEKRSVLTALPPEQMKALVARCSESQLSELTTQMLTSGTPPERIAEEAADDCLWENSQMMTLASPSTTPSTEGGPNPTPSPIPPPPTAPFNPWSLPNQWPILAFVLAGLALEVAFVGRKLALHDRKGRRIDQDDEDKTNPE
jgi:hypothetical protein